MIKIKNLKAEICGNCNEHWAIHGKAELCPSPRPGTSETYSWRHRDSKTLTYHDPICPHCSSPQRDPWEMGMRDEDCQEIECVVCEKPFWVRCCMTADYSTTFSEKGP